MNTRDEGGTATAGGGKVWRRTRHYRDALKVVRELRAGPRSIEDLADAIETEWHQAYRVTRALMDAGWPIEKEPDPQDGRRRLWRMVDPFADVTQDKGK